MSTSGAKKCVNIQNGGVRRGIHYRKEFETVPFSDNRSETPHKIVCLCFHFVEMIVCILDICLYD